MSGIPSQRSLYRSKSGASGCNGSFCLEDSLSNFGDSEPRLDIRRRSLYSRSGSFSPEESSPMPCMIDSFSSMADSESSLSSPLSVKKSRGKCESLAKIEVAPNVWMPLRGSNETKEAVDRGFIVPCDCMGCSSVVLCIKDAEFVICPSCRVVSPVEDNGCQAKVGGVGLGFTFDELVILQKEETYAVRGFE